MHVAIVVGLVLLPLAMYGLAWLLAVCRERLGITRPPRARAVSSIRPADPTRRTPSRA